MIKTLIVKTVCDLCSPNACGMNVHVKNGRVVKVEGMKEHPNSKGILCDKGKAVTEILYARDRLKHPLKRVGSKGEGKWKRISWNKALDAVAQRFNDIKRRSGPEAIAFLHGHKHAGEHSNYLRRLANVFGTPNVTSVFEICFAPRHYTVQYTLGENAAPNIGKSNCVFLWGNNPTSTSPPQEMRILNSKRRGSKLIVVDPRRIPLAEQADIYAQIRPGTDGALALSLLNVIIEERLFDTGFVRKWTVGFDQLTELVKEYPPEKMENVTYIKADTIVNIARMYAETKPACIIMGNAFDQNTNVFQSIRAINILMAITGNIDVPGGNIFGAKDPKPINPSLNDQLSAEQLSKLIGLNRLPICKIHRKAHTPYIWEAIIKGDPYSIQAMLIMAANPLVVFMNTKIIKEALEKLDFLVVSDFFMTETAKLADIILPSCTFLEETYYVQPNYFGRPDFDPSSPRFVALRRKVVEPIGESWPDLKIISELGKKLGYTQFFPWTSLEEVVDYELQPLGITFKGLESKPNGIIYYGKPLKYRKYEESGFHTPSKKVEIYSKQLEEMGINPLPVYVEPAESPFSKPELAKKYPLVLTTGAKLPMFIHSQLHNVPSLRKLMPENVIEVNSDTAKQYSIKDGGFVTVESPRGKVKCRAKITDSIHPKVVCMHHGFADANPNVLLDPGSCDSFTGSLGIKASLCKIEKIAGFQ